MKQWYKNQKARHEAKLAGAPRPRTGGLADRASDAMEARVNASFEAKAEHLDAEGKFEEAASVRQENAERKANLR